MEFEQYVTTSVKNHLIFTKSKIPRKELDGTYGKKYII